MRWHSSVVLALLFFVARACMRGHHARCAAVRCTCSLGARCSVRRGSPDGNVPDGMLLSGSTSHAIGGRTRPSPRSFGDRGVGVPWDSGNTCGAGSHCPGDACIFLGCRLGIRRALPPDGNVSLVVVPVVSQVLLHW